MSRRPARKIKIYTRGGDKGRTGLLDGSRVPKNDLRVVAYGDVDELCALVGLARAEVRTRTVGDILRQVQRDLMALGAQLADPKARVGARQAKAALTAALVERLESAIDAAEDRLPALTRFILPGGSRAAATIHVARTVCRRAERSVVAFAQRRQGVDPLVVAYLNRLSDLLFVLARSVNQSTGVEEDCW